MMKQRISTATVISAAVLASVVGLYGSETWTKWTPCTGDRADGIEYRFMLSKQAADGSACLIGLRDAKQQHNGAHAELLVTYTDSSNDEMVMRKGATINGDNSGRDKGTLSIGRCVAVRGVEVIGW